MNIHKKIAFYRRKCALSQEALAEKIGVSRQAVSKWETGDALPETSKLKALADYFGVTVDFLLDDNEETFTADKSDYGVSEQTPSQSKPSGIDKFDCWIDTLPERLMPFFKKYGWIGGIILAVIGAYNTVIRIAGCFTAFTAAGQFINIGMGGVTVPVILSSFVSVLTGIAMTVCGIIIVKKFKPKKK